jgi:hypothetical protein
MATFSALVSSSKSPPFRDLFDTVQTEGASKGILVTTSG